MQTLVQKSELSTFHADGDNDWRDGWRLFEIGVPSGILHLKIVYHFSIHYACMTVRATNERSGEAGGLMHMHCGCFNTRIHVSERC